MLCWNINLIIWTREIKCTIINTACLQDFYNYLAMQSGFDEVNLTIAENLQDVLFVEVRDCYGIASCTPRPILSSYMYNYI